MNPQSRQLIEAPQLMKAWRFLVIFVWECGAVSTIVARFSASQVVIFLDTFLLLLRGELFNVDGVDIHGIGIDFGG